MQSLIARGDAPTGATVPNQLSGARLWDLDVDDDLWTDLARDQQNEEDAPGWLYDEPTKQGIRAMLDLQCCEEEFKRLSHERSVMSSWLQGQGEQLQLASQTAQGIYSVVLPYSRSNSTNHKEIPPSCTRLNFATPTSLASVRHGT